MCMSPTLALLRADDVLRLLFWFCFHLGLVFGVGLSPGTMDCCPVHLQRQQWFLVANASPSFLCFEPLFGRWALPFVDVLRCTGGRQCGRQDCFIIDSSMSLHGSRRLCVVGYSRLVLQWSSMYCTAG